MQTPARKTCLLLLQDKQELEPPPEQLAQLESHVLHVPELESKYSDLAHVFTQRFPLVRTGADAGHVEHWLKPAPVQESQSGWHGVQAPLAANMLEGQLETQVPAEAS